MSAFVERAVLGHINPSLSYFMVNLLSLPLPARSFVSYQILFIYIFITGVTFSLVLSIRCNSITFFLIPEVCLFWEGLIAQITCKIYFLARNTMKALDMYGYARLLQASIVKKQIMHMKCPFKSMCHHCF